MSRQMLPELHVGQKVLVRPGPQAHAVEALVMAFDEHKGTVTVAPIGYAIKWLARPRAISDMNGLYLHHESDCFRFKRQPYFG